MLTQELRAGTEARWGAGSVHLEVQIVRLGPMRVASLYTFGTDPVLGAWEKLGAWASPRGLWGKLSEHPVYGFSDSGCLSSDPRFGYEMWIKVNPDIDPGREDRTIDFYGGSYAVVRFDDSRGCYQNTLDVWLKLYDWCQTHHYWTGFHQRLEKFIIPPSKAGNLILDLYYPLSC